MKLATVLLIAVTLLVFSQVAVAVADSPVVSVTVSQGEKTLVRLSAPEPFTYRVVTVGSLEKHIEAIVQLSPKTKERLLILSELDDLIITGLTNRGAMDTPKQRGLELTISPGENMVLKLTGVMPGGKREAMVMEIVGEDENGMRLLVGIYATITFTPGWLQAFGRGLKQYGGWIILGILVVGGLSWLIARRRSYDWRA